MAQLPDYYAVLGISRYATQEEITQKYHELLAQNPSKAQLERINAAYEVLSDLGERQRYDFDHSMSRIRGSYSDYVDEVIEDAASGERGTTLDDLMAQSRESLYEATGNTDDLMEGAEAISGESGATLDDLLADVVDDVAETATTLDDLMTAPTDTPLDEDVTTLDALLADAPEYVKDLTTMLSGPFIEVEKTLDAFLDESPGYAPHRAPVRKAKHKVKVGGSTTPRQSPANILSVIMAAVLGVAGVLAIVVFMLTEELGDSSVSVYPTTFVVYTSTPVPRPVPTQIFDAMRDAIMEAHAIDAPVNLSELDLSNIDLATVPLPNAVLVGTDFRNANLNAADLQNANLRDANLTGANLLKASLQGADLTGANLTNALLTGAYFSTATILPDGTTWTEDTDMARFTDPDHPDFWQGE